jgi:hypothetical protein
MDEEHWLAATDPTPMLEFLRDSGRATDRKLRLFAAARCRLFRPDWDDLWPTREAVDAAEQLSDGLSQAGQLARFHRPWEDFIGNVSRSTMDPTGGSTVLFPDCLGQLLVQAISSPSAGSAARGTLYDDLQSYFDGTWKDGRQERRVECHLLQEVFGNPFRPLRPLSPSVLDWNGGAAVKLAHAVYDERLLPSGHLDAARLAVLADMLEEAGATDAELLGHLRSAKPHVRGCHALDSILERG